MNIQTVLKEMIPFLVLFPSAVLCYLPMKHQLRFPARKLFFLIAAALCLYIPIAAWCKVVFAMDANFILVPSLILFYVGYHCKNRHQPQFMYICSQFGAFWISCQFCLYV